jgi:glutaminyl-peptide cyclotransferase
MLYLLQKCLKMKQTYIPFVILLSFFTTFLSCSNKPGRSRKPIINLNIEPSRKYYVTGDSAVIAVKIKISEGELETAKIYFNNKLIGQKNEMEFRFQLGKFIETGQQTIKIQAIKKDGVENLRSSAIMVYSDIAPQMKNYKIVKQYPHSVKSFTQGLEFLNGFLYEGTGENGSSGLYKVNLYSGNAVMSKKIDEKYFGEGITILNEKIYQITYKTQIGFVYKLENFALIDSFKYASAEGWGLTNDGKNLIMSNGTNQLTWLNQSDFSVVKTIQVADNKGLVKNLNELEYINGKILANLWQTDLIAEIDPESGKILSYINLKGLLSIMYQQQAERIDVLNGIAYDNKSGKLFVTGKLWPKLFEIELVNSK